MNDQSVFFAMKYVARYLLNNVFILLAVFNMIDDGLCNSIFMLRSV